MTPGLSKDIECHVRPYSFLRLQITKSDIRPHEKWAVGLVIADGHLIFLRGLCRYAWVNMLPSSTLRVPLKILAKKKKKKKEKKKKEDNSKAESQNNHLPVKHNHSKQHNFHWHCFTEDDKYLVRAHGVKTSKHPLSKRDQAQEFKRYNSLNSFSLCHLCGNLFLVKKHDEKTMTKAKAVQNTQQVDRHSFIILMLLHVSSSKCWWQRLSA